MYHSTSATAVRVRKLVHNLRHGRIAESLDGLTPAVEHEHLHRLDIDHLLDVGANRGQFSLLASDIWPRVRIDAFEPLDAAGDLFEKYLKATNVLLHRTALSNEPGTAQLHVSAADDSSSLRSIGDLQVEIFPGTEETGVVEVPVTTLDVAMAKTAISSNSLLKIDVQGAELDVLRGASKTLPRIGHVYVECSFCELYGGQALADQVITELQGSGFKLVGAYNVHYRDGVAIQTDLLFSAGTIMC